MTYEAFRISYQDSEQAARAAYTAYEKAAHDNASLLNLLGEIRTAVGDNGARMQGELIEYLKELHASTDNFKLLKHDIEIMEQALHWTEGRMNGCLDKSMEYYLLRFVKGRLFEAQEAANYQEKAPQSVSTRMVGGDLDTSFGY